MLWISKASPAFGSRFALGAGTALCALGMTMGAQGAPLLPNLLTIDLSNLANVTITTSTDNAGDNDEGNFFMNDGITLDGFFRNPSNVLNPVSADFVSSSLTSPASASASIYNTWSAGSDASDLDLVLRAFVVGTPDAQVFDIAKPALSGSGVINIASVLNILDVVPLATWILPAHGTIYSGAGGQGSIGAVAIGEWTAVPEASTTIQMSVVGLGCAGFLVNRARRRTA